jgi:hypothetical protein
MVLCALGALWTGQARAGAELHCDVTYAGATEHLVARPVPDPYTVPATDIRGRFRFKAVLVGTPDSVERVNLYVYQNTPQQPVLVQQARYLPPFARLAGGAAPLTGQQRLYAGPMERELIYSCTLEGLQP